MSTEKDHDLLVQIHEKVTQMELHLRLLNGRVRANERWRYMITGGLIFLSAMVGWMKFG